MWGFVGGSMALIVLYAVTQDKAAARIGDAGGVASKWLAHFISPNYAGIPQRSALTKQAVTKP